MPEKLSIDWISSKNIFEKFSEVGVTVTRSQFKSWRGAGILPAMRQFADHGHGSEVYYPPHTPVQARAATRAMHHTEDYNFSRKALWAAGYDIDAKYWRQALANADVDLKRAIKNVVPYAPLHGNKLASDRLPAAMKLPGSLAKIRARIRSTFDGFINDCADIATGKMMGFHPAIGGNEGSLSTWSSALDFKDSENDRVLGSRLQLREALEAILVDISQAFGNYSLKDFGDEEILAARDDVRNTLKIATYLYHATEWVYGRAAFGLRMVAFIAESISYEWLIRLSILFARLRRISTSLYSSDEIANMANNAETIWLMSIALRELIACNSKLAKMCSKSRLKLAFSDSREMENLLKEIEGCGLRMPEISPWDEWNKLSKTKKMPFGLLVMSIGSPDRLALAAIVPNAAVKTAP